MTCSYSRTFLTLGANWISHYCVMCQLTIPIYKVFSILLTILSVVQHSCRCGYQRDVLVNTMAGKIISVSLTMILMFYCYG